MKPGRELDTLVAEKVMGLNHDKLDGYPAYYSTDIAAAWEVVEKLIPDCFLTLQWIEGWEVSHFEPGPYGGHMHLAHGDSAPHAICLAALKALEERDSTKEKL